MLYPAITSLFLAIDRTLHKTGIWGHSMKTTCHLSLLEHLNISLPYPVSTSIDLLKVNLRLFDFAYVVLICTPLLTTSYCVVFTIKIRSSIVYSVVCILESMPPPPQSGESGKVFWGKK